mmetsp:Transcript_46741/g.52784  ORF Transcript_46741/g.52784 Transcript_46741/m.52784 type:complete len:96 (+) Transcript_46741:550-837(+)
MTIQDIVETYPIPNQIPNITIRISLAQASQCPHHFIHDWLPEWSGTYQLPSSLLDFPLVHLPDYFMNEVPAIAATGTTTPTTTTIVETTTAFPME